MTFCISNGIATSGFLFPFKKKKSIVDEYVLLIFIRLVDRHAGHWGHINFDDFRFHAEKPERSRRGRAGRRRADVYKYAGLPPEEGRQGDDGARRLRRQALRRRAGRAAADRHVPRRPRPALGRRGVLRIPIAPRRTRRPRTAS